MNTTELRDKIKSLTPLPENAKRFSWLARRRDLREKILNDNPENFLTWPRIKEALFVGKTKAIEMQLDWLLTEAGITLDDSCLQEHPFGNPETFDDGVCPRTSGNLVNQLFYLVKWSELTSGFVDKNIIEFGGGYGLMARIVQQLGFTGQYTIIDLPEYLLLQEYYLSNVLEDISNIQFVSTFDDYELDADLIISICSLSEVDEAAKNRFFEQVKFKYHLIVFQPDWDGWDNAKYFSDRFNDKPIVNEFYPNHQYLMAKIIRSVG